MGLFADSRVAKTVQVVAILIFFELLSSVIEPCIMNQATSAWQLTSLKGRNNGVQVLLSLKKSSKNPHMHAFSATFEWESCDSRGIFVTTANMWALLPVQGQILTRWHCYRYCSGGSLN